ncbi:unnamed protein product [Durusdinium trenchii]|uniref:Uncharacterized protein n=1 Tax=Durusdinium trenchii TaxID=1381693 RepID=A0ABP0PLL3_9DINO
MSMAAGLPGLDRLDMHGPHGCEAYLLTTEEIAVKAFLVLAGIGAFLFIMFATCRVHRPEHFFPSIVNASLIFGWLLGPLAILWTNAVRFGVMLVPSTATGSELHHTYNEVPRFLLE